MPTHNGTSVEFSTCNSISFNRKWVVESKFIMIGKGVEYMYECMYLFMNDTVLSSMYAWFLKYVGHFRVAN